MYLLHRLRPINFKYQFGLEYLFNKYPVRPSHAPTNQCRLIIREAFEYIPSMVKRVEIIWFKCLVAILGPRERQPWRKQSDPEIIYRRSHSIWNSSNADQVEQTSSVALASLSCSISVLHWCSHSILKRKVKFVALVVYVIGLYIGLLHPGSTVKSLVALNFPLCCYTHFCCILIVCYDGTYNLLDFVNLKFGQICSQIRRLIVHHKMNQLLI